MARPDYSHYMAAPAPVRSHLPQPHPAQQQVIHEARRFNVVCCGRRWGKSTLGIDRLIKPVLEGFPCAWFSPTYNLLMEAWRALQETLASVVVSKNNAEMPHTPTGAPTFAHPVVRAARQQRPRDAPRPPCAEPRAAPAGEARGRRSSSHGPDNAGGVQALRAPRHAPAAEHAARALWREWFDLVLPARLVAGLPPAVLQSRHRANGVHARGGRLEWRERVRGRHARGEAGEGRVRQGPATSTWGRRAPTASRASGSQDPKGPFCPMKAGTARGL